MLKNLPPEYFMRSVFLRILIFLTWKHHSTMSIEEFRMVDDLEEPDEDSYETACSLVSRMETNYNLRFELDAAAKDYNTKCPHYLTDALHQEWVITNPVTAEIRKVDVWLNGPHSLNEQFIKRADAQHKKHNINICMIVPTNCQSMPTWHRLIENETKVITENHPLLKRPVFYKRGRKTKHSSRNAYRVIIWRKSVAYVPITEALNLPILHKQWCSAMNDI